MFLLPMLVAVYILFEYAKFTDADETRLILIGVFATMLGAGGYFVCRSVVHALLQAVSEAEAIAGGDISRRMATDTAGEISELARNFNKITTRLQKTIDGLQTSKKQIQELISQVCAAPSAQTVDMSDMLDVFLGTLLSLTGLDRGAIFLFSPDGKSLEVGAARGVDESHRSTVIPAGKGIIGWVAVHGQVVTISESMPWGHPEGLSPFERSMPWGIHVPIGTTGKVRGVVSIGLREGKHEITGDDLLMIQNLATQMAVALENAELKEEMEKTYVETVAALANAVEARDQYTRGHSRRVTRYAVEIALRMNMPDAFIRDLEAASLLHDIGKIGIPDTILRNTDVLAPDGWEFIHEHPIGGEKILKPVGSLSRLCPIVRHHHERFDGSGYPDRLTGEEIPLASRIIAVADSFDAMVSDRAYRPTRTREDAMEELVRCRGTQFDPRCVDVFLSGLESRAGESAACPA